MKEKKTYRNVREKYLITAGASLFAIAAAQASSDYGPAIWRPAYPNHWYTTGYGHKFYVEHDMEGYYASTIPYLQQSSTTVSVHYCVNGKQDTGSDYAAGEITQMVLEANYAWHVKCWNQHCSGTEHEGFRNNPAWYTEAMYQASSGITRHNADKFGFAKDRNHIVGHDAKSSSAWVSWANANLGINASCNSHNDPGPYWDWNHFMALVLGSAPPPSADPYWNGQPVGYATEGRMQLFGSSTASTMHTIWQTAPGGSWVGWQNFGGSALGQIAVGHSPDGRMQVFAVGTDAAIRTSWQTAPGGAWSAWTSWGPAFKTNSLAIGYALDGRMQLFAIGTDNNLWTQSQTSPGGAWTGWANYGGGPLQSGIAVGRSPDGRLQVFAVGTDNTVKTTWQTTPGGGWAAWAGFGGSVKAGLALGTAPDGRMQLFAVSTADNSLQTTWQTVPGGGWVGWQSFGGSIQAGIGVGYGPDGSMQLFAPGTDNSLQTIWQNGPGGAWTAWQNYGGYVKGRVAVGHSPDKRMQVFAVNNDNAVWTKSQTSPGGAWTSWANYGGAIPGGF